MSEAPIGLSCSLTKAPCGSPSRLENRLLALEQALRSVVSGAPRIAPSTGDSMPDFLRENAPPISNPDLSRTTMNGHQNGQGLPIGIEDGVFAENATLDDTVDGMAVITFADEVGSGYFGMYR